MNIRIRLSQLERQIKQKPSAEALDEAAAHCFQEPNEALRDRKLDELIASTPLQILQDWHDRYASEGGRV